jgi:5-(carboxyamino)imidazole ribonucleotide synthase
MSIGRKPRVGVLGAGQLALMLAEAGQHIGVEVVCAGRAGDCAGRVAMLKEVDLESAEEVRAFSGEVDVPSF